MSMKMLTILQFIQIMCAYLIMTVLLPAFILRVKLRGRRLAEKFLICFLIGNFYIMNLVFLLQLLHISNRITLGLGTFVPAFIIWIKLNDIKLLPKFRKVWQEIRRLSAGYLGVKTAIYRICGGILKGLKTGMSMLLRGFGKRWLEWLLILAILVALGSFYGIQLLRGYGYTASDTPVHLYWINGLEDNHIFIDGVYPFGYHCVIYYIHKLFHIDSYVMMRIFSFVQTIMIHIVLLAFLRLCCKSKYVAYAVVAVFILGDFLQPSTYLRFFAVLPQEYGMLFILPSIYFAFRFFEVKRKERKKESFQCLALFAISFSMTLAVHFYDTMIAGLFCVGVAVGYLFLFVRKQYFGRVVLTCFISVMIAVLPMGIAFANGTPLQGSLNWGMSVINGESWNGEGGNEESENEPVIHYYDPDGNLIESPLEVDSKSGKQETKISVNLTMKIKQVWDKLCGAINRDVLNEPAQWYCFVVLAAIGGLLVLGFIFFLSRRNRCYGAMLSSTGIFMILLLLLQAAGELGLPELMDGNRCRIYFAYMLPVVFGMFLDGFIRLICYPKRWVMLRNFFSLLCVAGAVLFLWNGDNRKPQVKSETLVTNEAITCLTNIIREEKDFTWTIVSANDEMQMGYDHGYHYESISLLRGMELNHMEKDEKPVIKIPTDSIYVFIEKVPINYTLAYEKSGQKISTEGAKRELPNVGGIEMYKGENRWIVMSRLYYWAEEFKRLYPNEVKTYCETENFICYKIKQNPYRLFNFAIDYGYNSRMIEG